jgi:hypothetical protein
MPAIQLKSKLIHFTAIDLFLAVRFIFAGPRRGTCLPSILA